MTASCTPPALNAKRDEIIKSANGKKFRVPDGTPEKRATPLKPSCPAPLKYLATQAVSSICSCIVTPATKTSTVVQTFPAATSTATAPTSTLTIMASDVLVYGLLPSFLIAGRFSANTPQDFNNYKYCSHYHNHYHCRTPEPYVQDFLTPRFQTSTMTIPVATATVMPAVAGGGSCGCSYTSNCGTQYVDTGDGVYITQASSLQECIQQCDENFLCSEYSFQYSTGVCTQLHGRYNALANADFASGAVATDGRCNGVCTASN